MNLLLQAQAGPSLERLAPRTTRDLHLVSPMMRGEDVLAVQERLAAGGYSPGRLDGYFGLSTEASVRAFQAANGLEADGIVGRSTRRALAEVRPSDGPVPLRRHRSPQGAKALAEATRWIGTKEELTNRTRFGRWYGVDGVAWCAIFMSYCFSKGAKYTLCEGFHAPGVNAKGCAYVPTMEAWLRGTGQWVGRTSALLPGDLVLFNWDQQGVPEHIGIVERVLGPDRFQTIEGNTAVGNDSGGGAVMRRVRHVTQLQGAGRVGMNHHHAPNGK